jgi:hypothetical protein
MYTSEYGGDTLYSVDAVIGGEHVEDALVMEREIMGTMKTKPHAHRKRVSRRRLKVYQRRKAFEDWCKNPPQLTTLNYTADPMSYASPNIEVFNGMLSSLGSGTTTVNWTEIGSGEEIAFPGYPYYSHVGKPLKWGDRTVQLATEVIGAIGDKPGHVMTKRVILDCATGKPMEGMIYLGSHVANGTPGGPLYVSKVVDSEEVKQIEGA